MNASSSQSPRDWKKFELKITKVRELIKVNKIELEDMNPKSWRNVVKRDEAESE